jgi:hypothetical protein
MRRTAALCASLLAACAADPPPTWLDVLVPLAPGEEVLPGWVLQPPRRGFEHDVVLDVLGPDGAKVEVHVVDAGRWPEALPAGPYGVDWEAPRTSAPKETADALTRAVADAVRAHAAGLPVVDEVRLGTEPPGPLDAPVRALSGLGTRAPLPLFGPLVAVLALALAARRPTSAPAGQRAPTPNPAARPAPADARAPNPAAKPTPDAEAPTPDAEAPTPIGDAARAAVDASASAIPRPDARVAAAPGLAAAPAHREALVVGLAAFALRLALGAFSPFHANGQGNLWVAGARDPALLSHYGPGYPELFGAVAQAWPPELALFTTNAALSAATCAALTAVARAWGLDPARAALAGLLLALDPVAIRVAATESYLVPAALLPLVVALAGHRGGPAGLALVAVSAALAARLHPTAWPPLALAPLLVPTWRAAATTALSAGLGAALTSGVVLADVLRAVDDGRLARPGADLDPARLTAALALCAAVAWRARPLLPAVAAAAAADLALRASYAQHDLWQLAFDLLYLPALLLGLAAVTPSSLGRPATLGLAAALTATSALGLQRGAWLTWRSVDHHEHHAARAWLADLEPGCAVLYVARTDAVVTVHLPVPQAGVTLVPLDARGPLDLRPLVPAGCVWYLRTSACSTTTGAAACARVEAGLTLSEGATITLPAVPSHRDVRYRGDTVTLMFQPVEGLAAPK